MEERHSRWLRSARAAGFALAVTGLLLSAGEAARADWWSENFEAHGFVSSKIYFRSPNFNEDPEISQWRNELNLETELRLYRGDEVRVGLYGVFRPIFDGVYEVQSDLWGKRVEGGIFGSGDGAFSGRAGRGEDFPGAGICLDGEFCTGNADTGSLFTDELAPAISIDDVVFFGAVTAPIAPKGSRQAPIGGNATGETYEDYLNSNFRNLAAIGTALDGAAMGDLPTALAIAAAGTNALQASLTPAGSFTSGVDPVTGAPNFVLPGQASAPLGTPLNAYFQGGIGDANSLEQSPVDINRSESELKWECGDNAHPWCFVRELYAEVEFGNTFMRIGKQQIVWGKTDAFRLQDNLNPLDIGYHNVFPDLEERRIPQLAIDIIHSFGDVGPLQDVSLEFVTIFDKFLPLQFGQCGEPYAFTAACESRADAGGHQLFNFSLAAVDEVEWGFENFEPGVRVEFRIPEPSIAFSFSAFWAHQDLPVAQAQNLYSTNNPNPASLLFLQGFGLGSVIETFADVLDNATFAPVPDGIVDDVLGKGRAPIPVSVGGTPWSTGFDPYAARNSDGSFVVQNVTNSQWVANEVLKAAWENAFNAVPPASGGCAGLSGQTLGECADALGALGLPWSASEFILKYPRVLTLGASMDYQVPGIDTVLRIEMAYDVDRGINNTASRDAVDESDVFLAAIGLDRSTFIPFLNANRTAFLSFQTFFEHVIDYDDGRGKDDGMIVDETNVISTMFMQNYWRNDSIILTSFLAYDWKAQAWITGPYLRWVYDEHLFFDVGVNLLWGKQQKHNIRDICADSSLSCLGDPDTWNDGNWQLLNRDFFRTAESPFFGKESFADQFMESRDEFWFGVTYQW